jgi:hypothetical protein
MRQSKAEVMSAVGELQKQLTPAEGFSVLSVRDAVGMGIARVCRFVQDPLRS